MSNFGCGLRLVLLACLGLPPLRRAEGDIGWGWCRRGLHLVLQLAGRLGCLLLGLARALHRLLARLEHVLARLLAALRGVEERRTTAGFPILHQPRRLPATSPLAARPPGGRHGR
jgi:hypothetical protein